MYYRVCRRSKLGGANVRSLAQEGAPVLGHIPFGCVFNGSVLICNEQGDQYVKIPSDDARIQWKDRLPREAWVAVRTISNELILEQHNGPFVDECRYYQCVIEGCKVRQIPDVEQEPVGYVLYGDVLTVTESVVTDDGLVYLKLHEDYLSEPVWVLERTLDNESILVAVEGPSTTRQYYRCVQRTGAPIRPEPDLASPPCRRIPCGSQVVIEQRFITPERQIFLKLEGVDEWIIERSTCCSSVMVKIQTQTH